MKVSKSLLASITAGVFVLGAVSCEQSELLIEDNDRAVCSSSCNFDHEHITSDPDSNPDEEWDWEDCPACGMG